MSLRRLVPVLLLAGCFGHFPEPQNDTYDRRDGPVEYRVVQGTEGVIHVAVRIAEPGPVPDLAALEARCRREVARIGLAEAARRNMPPPHRVLDRFVTGNARHDPGTGTSRCVAETPVFPSDGQPWDR